MMPQLDTSFYFSQAFWLVVSISILVMLFKKYYIPRMNSIMKKREQYISNSNLDIKQLESNIYELNDRIENLRNESIRKSSEIINSATKKSENILNEQIRIIKQENEELIYSTRKRLDEEIKNLNSAFKAQIEITAQTIFSKIFEKEI